MAVVADLPAELLGLAGVFDLTPALVAAGSVGWVSVAVWQVIN